MSAKDPAERALISQLAAHSMWAKCEDRTARSEPGRQAFLAKFERQVDPDGTLDPAERAKRAESARKAYFARIALRSAQVRRIKARAKGEIA